MKFVLLMLIIIHGLIHVAGFVKAFNLASVNQLSQNISRINGMFWLVSALLFMVTALFFFLKKDTWWIPAAFAIIISQFLIFTSWHDAKFGTIANVIILIAAIISWGTWNFQNKYENKVRSGLKNTTPAPDSILTETDLQYLPDEVKKYMHSTGVVGRPKVRSFKVEFSGQIRKDEQAAWMPFTSEQYNFMEKPTRLFFMKAIMKHFPVAGFHCFENGNVFMDIRLLSLFRVQYQEGKEMDIAETVTFFNDMCCMAPATLIDKRIKWLETEGNKVKASFTNNHITIAAWLYFNEQGELVNFISDDRYAAAENNTMKRLRWSTPVRDHKEINGYKLGSSADAIYSYPEGDLCYGKFTLTNIEYNSKKVSQNF